MEKTNSAPLNGIQNHANQFFSGVRPWVFWPPFLLLLAAVIYSFVDLDGFMKVATAINNWILATFADALSLSSLCLLLLLLITLFSPLANIRIGGSKATPLLSKWRWFSITLCTTVATGILFWGTAEPMFHLYSPPESLNIAPNSDAAREFTMATMFMHWSFTPYAIYCLPGLVFALCYYNLRQPFSLGASLNPLLCSVLGKEKGRQTQAQGGQVIDAIALFALVAGMASSLGTGILVLGGGAESVLSIPNGKLSMAVIATAIVTTFIVSAISGLQKGIARLSNLNAQIFIFCCVFVFAFGPTAYLLNSTLEGIQGYASSFFARSVNRYTGEGDNWPQLWTVFYWSNWYAWAPVTALFLGRIARGYTVRQFITINLLLPASAAILWMGTFSGSALYFDQLTNGTFQQEMLSKGSESVVFLLFNNLPFAALTSVVFIFVTFISFVTAADSNTDAMSNICANGNLDPDSPGNKTSLTLKFVWGITIGIIAWVMVSFASLDGIKMMSNLGGLPSMFIIAGTALSLLVLLGRVMKGDTLEPSAVNGDEDEQSKQ